MSKASKTAALTEYNPFDGYEFINVNQSLEKWARVNNKIVKTQLRTTKGDKQKIINYLNKTSSHCIWLIENRENRKKEAIKLSDEINSIEILLFSHEERQFKKDHLARLWKSVEDSEDQLVHYDNIYLSLLESIEQKPREKPMIQKPRIQKKDMWGDRKRPTNN